MNPVFISHVEEDQSIALELATKLESAGYITWYYERDMIPGPPYLLQVGRAIDSAAAVALIISPHSLGSHQVTGEVVRALEMQKSFIPLRSNISHIQFQNRQPIWRQALGASASVAIPPEGVTAIIPRVIAGLQFLGITPPSSAETPLSENEAATPRSVIGGSKLQAEAICQVFISCTCTEQALAKQLHDFLQNRGMSAFLSGWSEKHYPDVIDQALTSATCLVVLGTAPEAFDSGWVGYEWRSFLNEIRSGRKSNGQLFALVGGVAVEQLPFALRRSQLIPVSPSSPQDAFESLARHLKKALGDQALNPNH